MELFDNLKRQLQDQGGKLLNKFGWYAIDGYEAATYSRDRSWIQTPVGDLMINPSEFTRTEITRMSRWLINNYPLAERIASLCEIYGIGAGISANAATIDPNFNSLASDAFDTWASSVFCTSDNELSFYEAQKLMARELLICGEVFIVLIKTQNAYPQIMLALSEQVTTTGKEGDNSVDGIYFDAYGKALAYNVFTGNGFQKISADNVIHLKRVKNVGQKRGVGMFASSLNAMRDHKDMHTLIKKSLKTQLTMAVVVTQNTPDAGEGIMGNMFPLDQNGNPTTAPTATVNTGLERVFGSSVKYMQNGEKVDLLASEHPTENVKDFLELIMRDVCLSVSLPYEFVVNPGKLNGTAMRFTIQDAAAFFATLQTIMIDGAFNRIYIWVIASLMKQGKLPAPVGNVLPWDVVYTRPCSLTVDQGRMSNAEIALLESGLLNREMYFSARGKDWKKEISQLIAETKFIIEQAKANEIPLAILMPTLPGSQPTPEEQDQAEPEAPEQPEEEQPKTA